MSENNRITSLDALRGIVLLGILLVHSAACFCFESVDILSSSLVDSFLEYFIGSFLVNRCNIIFGILFCVSFYLILKNSNYTAKKFVWRCVLLLILGLFMKLFYLNNILRYYGFAGIILVCFRNMKIPHLLYSSILTFLLYYILSRFSVGSLMLDRFTFCQYDITNYAIINSIADLFVTFFDGGIFLYLSYFILGYYLGRYGFVDNLYKYLTIKNIVVFWGGYFFLYTLVSYAYIYSINIDVRAFFVRLRDLFGAMSYALLFLYIYERVGKHLSWLEAYGKLGLTNYCLQDILAVVFMTTIFTKGEYSFTFMLFFFVGVYLLLLLFSIVWLRYFKYGPLEWVWRCLTNLQYISNYHKK